MQPCFHNGPSRSAIQKENERKTFLLLFLNHGFESQSRGSVFTSSIELKNCHIYTVTIVIHKSRNLVGTGGTAKFGTKWGQIFRVIL